MGPLTVHRIPSRLAQLPHNQTLTEGLTTRNTTLGQTFGGIFGGKLAQTFLTEHYIHSVFPTLLSVMVGSHIM